MADVSSEKGRLLPKEASGHPPSPLAERPSTKDTTAQRDGALHAGSTAYSYQTVPTVAGNSNESHYDGGVVAPTTTGQHVVDGTVGPDSPGQRESAEEKADDGASSSEREAHKKNNESKTAAELEAEADKLEQTETRSVNYDTRGLTSDQVTELRKEYGWNEVKPRQVPEWFKVLKKYLSLVPILLIVAALFAVCVVEDNMRDWFSFALLIFLNNSMVWADYIGQRSAHNAIAAVEKLGAPICQVKRDGEWQNREVRELVPGDIVHLKAGVIMPADGVFVTNGATVTVDESALTGESVPIRKHPGAPLLSGSVVDKGEGEMLVTKTGNDSFYGKTLSLLARAERQGYLETVLHRAQLFITFVAACCAVFLFFWQSFHPDWKLIIPERRYLIALKHAFILIASVAPAAMPVVTTTVLSVGALTITKQNAAVSRLSAIEEAAGVVILFSDKTGTLTKNELSLFKEESMLEPGYDEKTMLLYASLCSDTQEPEPIDRTINGAADMAERAKYRILEYVPFNPVDKRTEATVVGPDGKKFVTTKGAPQVIRDLVCYEDQELRQRLNELILNKAKRGLRTLGVAVKPLPEGVAGNAPRWQLVGYLSLFDPPREDTAATIKRANELGIRVIMITGDQQAIAVETARQLHMGTNIVGPEVWKEEKETGMVQGKPLAEFIETVDGFAGVFPEHKYAIVNAMMDAHKLVAMTGDGVNDAPALKRATIGIAVSGATQAARAAADIILFAPGLKTIITVMSLSRQIFKRVESYIIFRIFTSLIILGMWWGSIVILRYQFPSWTLVLMSMINDFVLMSCSRDRVSSSSSPMIWSMMRVIFLSIWLGFLATVSILLYVVFADPSHLVNWWPRWGLPKFIPDWPLPVSEHFMSYQTNAGVWLLMTVLIQLSFQSVRTRGVFCWYNKDNQFPALVIIIPQVCAVLLTIFLSIYWKIAWRPGSGPRMVGLNWGQAWVTIFWGLLWFFVMDATKIGFYKYAWPMISRNKMYHAVTMETPCRQEIENRNVALKAMEDTMRFLQERERKVDKFEEKVEDVFLTAITDAGELGKKDHGRDGHIHKTEHKVSSEPGVTGTPVKASPPKEEADSFVVSITSEGGTCRAGLEDAVAGGAKQGLDTDQKTTEVSHDLENLSSGTHPNVHTGGEVPPITR
ncbi:ATPase, related [Neospora caninum Liverpool]|uniref:Plasma membrane ATPase n=1 Tax=Neospora caninum (strain Liverpool) TaxID=572307 RepID=F0VFE1_NEOCL|nr:ATPase, related [Neospora caninum Liverpool]CBZ52435.1 ATPase, related [Neospora caninum Liverpool]CEL66409.1 TPA: ATPase, related [Neospora caninum Liverpool]|eukprot:XP_003882467.1 ATPase, related [Neospora caninum Liverpool]